MAAGPEPTLATRGLFLPAPLEAGAGTGSSPASFRAYSGARLAQDGRIAPVLAGCA
jgi:hypothetical protein